MGYTVNWTKLPKDLVISLAHRLSFLEEFFQFILVCKSWKLATEDCKPLWLPTRYPLLLLAEDVAPGAIRYVDVYDQDYSDFDEDVPVYDHYYSDTDEDEEDYSDIDDNDGVYNQDCSDKDEDADDDDNEEDDGDDLVLVWKASYNYLKNSIGTSRGLYSLLSAKTYKIELPEAAGRLVLGTNKGWLVTLGRDLQINLLHPLLRHQFSLPPMLTFPRQYNYHEDYTPEQATDQFIRKVAMSSRLLTCETDVSIFHYRNTSSPIVMAVYGELGFLGFARLGDKVWTDVNVPSRCFDDIVYHRGNFYAIDNQGDVYVCCIDDDKEKGGPRGMKIASFKSNSCDQQYYLVETLSGSGLLLLVRYSKTKYIRHGVGLTEVKYRTTDFAVRRLDINYNDSVQTPLYTVTEVNNLGNEAIFIGRASSLTVSSSEVVRPNSIYFTDDNWGAYIRRGGGHDMGIFDMASHTIEPHFHGKSIHPISPPLWCI